MDTLALLDAGSCEVERFLSWERSLLRVAEAEPAAPPRMVVARLVGDAVLIGRFQSGDSCLTTPPSVACYRRLSGGRAIRVGSGMVGLGLAVANMGDMLDGPIPPARFINRYVRGILSGLTRAGAPGGAHYFGRDFISAEQKQIAVVGQCSGARAGLIEVFIAVDREVGLPEGWNGYPVHGDPRAGGPPHASLNGLRPSPLPGEELVSILTRGFAEHHGCTLGSWSEPAEEAWDDDPPVHEERTGWTSSGFAEIPIGFLEGEVKLDGPRIAGARLRGDFMASELSIGQIEAEVVSKRPVFSEIGPLVDAAFHQPGAFVHGLKELRLLADALIAAATEAPT